jgi:hypothetical protein
MVETQLLEGLDSTLQYQALVLLMRVVVVVGTTLLLHNLLVEWVEGELVAIVIHTTAPLGLLIQGVVEVRVLVDKVVLA